MIMIPADRTILHSTNGSFAELVTSEAAIFRGRPRELRAVFCPDCQRHYTIRPPSLAGWPSSIAHIQCTRCGKGAA